MDYSQDEIESYLNENEMSKKEDKENRDYFEIREQ